MLGFLRRRWRKNWPELRATLRGGMPAFVFSTRPRELGDAVPVFWYHAVDAGALEADLRFLADNGYRTLTADGLLEHLRREQPAPPRTVVLSFDDGARNLHDVVFPLLQRHAATAVAFVAPQHHEHVAAADPGRACTWDELRAMHRDGCIDVQSHTLEHRSVPRWPEPVPLTGVAPGAHRYSGLRLEMEDDFRLARERIELRLGKVVRHLAFPRFDGSAEAVAAAHRAGYEAIWWGLTPRRPVNRPGDDGTHIVRLSGEFVQRLPGHGRTPLAAILRRRYGAGLGRMA